MCNVLEKEEQVRERREVEVVADEVEEHLAAIAIIHPTDVDFKTLVMKQLEDLLNIFKLFPSDKPIGDIYKGLNVRWVEDTLAISRFYIDNPEITLDDIMTMLHGETSTTLLLKTFMDFQELKNSYAKVN